MTLSSLVNQTRAMLEEQARHLLTEVERQTMGYYVEEYREGHIGVEQLVVALFELLNTHAKVKACFCTPVGLCGIGVRFEFKFSETFRDLYPGFSPKLTALFCFLSSPDLKSLLIFSQSAVVHLVKKQNKSKAFYFRYMYLQKVFCRLPLLPKSWFGFRNIHI